MMVIGHVSFMPTSTWRSYLEDNYENLLNIMKSNKTTSRKTVITLLFVTLTDHFLNCTAQDLVNSDHFIHITYQLLSYTIWDI